MTRQLGTAAPTLSTPSGDPSMDELVALFESMGSTKPVPSDGQRLQEAHRNWIKDNLKPDSLYQAETYTLRPLSRRLRPLEVRQTFQEYVKHRNSRVFGRKWKDHALQIAAFLEGGESTSKHLHIHAVSEIPMNLSASEFAYVSLMGWRRMRYAGRENHFEVCTDPKGWVDYISKFKGKARFADSPLLEVTHL